MKRMASMVALLAFALIFMTIPGFAAEKMSSKTFIKKASSLNIGEINAAKQALDKTSSSEVRDFAKRMIDDHTSANQELAKLADQKKLQDKMSEHADAKSQANSLKLKVMSGKSFDKAYIKSQVDAHQETIKIFRQEAEQGQDSDLKAFAKKMLPTLEEHLKMANDLNNKLQQE